ncbi:MULTISPECIES: Rv3654c family TadE-like protein [unclassified Knoellia]|uniref:Rv3654c family TadE-like protein n=1 Tax=Knoellia altitudinis TaxID=3404795 RepID=UPI00360CA8EF
MSHRRRRGHGPPKHRDESGSGTVLVVAAMGVLLVLVIAALHLGAAATAAHRARTAADLAALAGAATLQDGDASPCARAAQVAGRNRARLVACALVGESVSVRVATAVPARWPGVPDEALASARAGPAPTPLP